MSLTLDILKTFEDTVLEKLMKVSTTYYDSVQAIFRERFLSSYFSASRVVLPQGFRRWYCLQHITDRGSLTLASESHTDVLEIIFRNSGNLVFRKLNTPEQVNKLFVNLLGLRSNYYCIRSNERLRTLLKYCASEINTIHIFEYIINSAEGAFQVICQNETMNALLRDRIDKTEGGIVRIYQDFVWTLKSNTLLPIRYVNHLNPCHKMRGTYIKVFVIKRLVAISSEYAYQLAVYKHLKDSGTCVPDLEEIDSADYKGYLLGELIKTGKSKYIKQIKIWFGFEGILAKMPESFTPKQAKLFSDLLLEHRSEEMEQSFLLRLIRKPNDLSLDIFTEHVSRKHFKDIKMTEINLYIIHNGLQDYFEALCEGGNLLSTPEVYEALSQSKSLKKEQNELIDDYSDMPYIAPEEEYLDDGECELIVFDDDCECEHDCECECEHEAERDCECENENDCDTLESQ